MATPSRSLFFLFLCLLAVLANANPDQDPCPCECPQQTETRLQYMYLHQFPFWPNVSNTNERYMVNSTTGFGNMYVDNWFLTIGPDPNGMVVARAQGFHILTDVANSRWYTAHVILFLDGTRFAGSTIDTSGLIVPSAGEWSITGGTGVFANAQGTIKYKDVPSTDSSITDIVRELDVHIFTPETTSTEVKFTPVV